MTFVKGKSGNPSGRPKLPDDVRKLMRDDTIKFHKALSKTMSMTVPQLQAMIANKTDATALELAIATTMSKAIKEGDYQRLKFLIERTSGKLPEKIDLDAPDLAGLAAGPQVTHALLFEAIQQLGKRGEE